MPELLLAAILKVLFIKVIGWLRALFARTLTLMRSQILFSRPFIINERWQWVLFRLRRLGLRLMLVLHLYLLRHCVLATETLISFAAARLRSVLHRFYRVFSLTILDQIVLIWELAILLISVLSHCITLLVWINILLLPIIVLGQIPWAHGVKVLGNSFASVGPFEVIESKQVQRVHLIGLIWNTIVKLVFIGRDQHLDLLLIHVVHPRVDGWRVNWHQFLQLIMLWASWVLGQSLGHTSWVDAPAPSLILLDVVPYILLLLYALGAQPVVVSLPCLV